MKNNDTSKKIAVVILNLVQYYTLKPFIDSYKKADIHIYVPKPLDESDGFSDMFNNTYHFLEEKYPSVYMEVQDFNYDIYIEQYPCTIEEGKTIRSKIRIKYKYSAISAKANPSYSPDFNNQYDVILCYSKYEQELLSAYAKTVIVGKLNYYNFHKEKHKKKTILYLPTYGNHSSLNNTVVYFKKLKADYKIIAKMHHGTTYLTSEKQHFDKINDNIFNEIYDEKTPLECLLSKADLVISDNSGAIFEAIYAGVPVCIIAGDSEKNKKGVLFDTIDSYQNTLKSANILPYCNDLMDIDKLVLQGFSEENLKRQSLFREKEFLIPQDKILSSFTNVIDYYLNELPLGESDFIKLKHSLYILEKEKYQKILEDNKNIHDSLKNVLGDAEKVKAENYELKNRKLYKICNKVYNIFNKRR